MKRLYTLLVLALGLLLPAFSSCSKEPQRAPSVEKNSYEARFSLSQELFSAEGGEGEVTATYRTKDSNGKIIEEGKLTPDQFTLVLKRGDEQAITIDQATKRFVVQAGDQRLEFVLEAYAKAYGHTRAEFRIIREERGKEPAPQPKRLTVESLQEIKVEPSQKGARYAWLCTTPQGVQTRYATDEVIYFWALEPGVYALTCEIETPSDLLRERFEITVTAPAALSTPYISKVFEYRPAPGQFINKLPKWSEGMTASDMAQAALAVIGGTKKSLLTLGGFGGYLLFGFDHIVPNLEGEDLAIWGNAFIGSSEPGIVMVSFDANHNGLPDDAWYELSGSVHEDPETIKGYEITYYRPTEDTPDDQYIKWTDNQGKTGYIPKNEFHNQNYYPNWITEDSYTLRGTRLKDNATLEESKIWKQTAFEWGYVDNLPNNTKQGAQFDLSQARDESGQSVALPGVHFVKVYTAVNQVAGQIGETSTEVQHAYDLHLKRLIDKKK